MAPHQEAKLIKSVHLGNIMNGILIVIGSAILLNVWNNGVEWHDVKHDVPILKQDVSNLKTQVSDHYSEFIDLKGKVAYKP